MKNNFEEWVKKIIKPTGITIDGSKPWDIKIINPNFYNRVKSQGSLGLGESYMDGWWECERLDEFFYRLLVTNIPSRIGLSFPVMLSFVRAKLFNLQAIRRAFEVGEKHYDAGNDLFTAMLGKTMGYSCGYWKTANNLDQAQEAKFDLICKKLNLQKGQKILDIGCGWGSFAFYAAKNYGVNVLGITVSKEQLKLAKHLCEGLPVDFRLQDYRDLNEKEKFDHIVSVGMFEHVGSKNYKNFLKIAKNFLKDDGLFLLHTIGSSKTGNNIDPWFNKYIFPNGMLPSIRDISSNAEGLFMIEDMHNFGSDYDKTLMAWHENFEKNWPELKNKYGDKFYRMWNYYLLSLAGSFRARYIQLWQIVLSPSGVPGGYNSIR
jgi:cyclopropane-fatty-acyl-phospholipid synthase